MRRMGFVLLVMVLVAAPGWAGQEAAAKPAGEAKLSPAQAALARLKALEGIWVGKASHGNPPAEPGSDTTVEYKITGNGSAVAETLFPGTPHEMLTLYFIDGEDLLLTHYCAAGNQPTMKARLGADPAILEFEFVRGTNMKPTDMHMHAARIVFGPGDRVESTWSSFQDGKAAGQARFELSRKK